MGIKKRIGALALILVLATQSNLVSASTIEISTLSMELKSNEQVYEEGTKLQLSNVNDDTMVFIKDIAFDAIESGRDFGLYPSVTIAQAVLESGSGKSGLSTAPNHNIFGIKGFYEGQSVRMRTKEDDGSGNLYEIYSNFKKYPNKEAALRDHDRLLRYGLNGFYSCAWRENAGSPREATQCLQGRYATDTRYSSKLMNIIDTYNLERFDDLLTPRDLKWLSSDSLDPWELPIIKEGTMEKIQTWASGANDSVRFSKKLKDVIESIENGDWEEYSADKYYIEQVLGVEIDFDEEIERYKENPKAGDIAVYKVETGDHEIIEHYAIVEGFRQGSILISEGTMSENGFHEVYRVVLEDSLERYEFISVEELIEVKEITEIDGRTEDITETQSRVD